jgi:hypothetical protein
MTVLTHVVACDGRKAKLIAILDKIALLHNIKKTFDREPESEERMDALSSCGVMIMSCCLVMIQLTHVVACDGQQANLIAILEQIALLHTHNIEKRHLTEHRGMRHRVIVTRHHDSLLRRSVITS